MNICDVNHPASDNKKRSRRKLYRFAVVSVLLLCALWVCWLGRRAYLQRETVKALRDHMNNHATYDFEFNGVAEMRKTVPEWVRRLCGNDLFNNVISVGINDQDVEDSHLLLLRNLPQLKGLHIYGENTTKLTEDGFRCLEDLRKLVWLRLLDTKITDVELAYLSHCRDLLNLEISGENISDAGLKKLANLSQLKYLYLSGTHVTDQGLRYLSDMKDMDELDLSATEVTGTGLHHLESLTKLKSLYLSTNKLKPGTLRSISNMPSLTHLDLGGTNIDDSQLSEIDFTKAEKLRNLWIYETKVSDKKIKDLQNKYPDLVIHTSNDTI